jgi:signal transduction histidine kinase
MHEVIGHEERLRQLIGASAALGSGLPLDELLQRIVEAAAALTGARYAALGVIDPSASMLERFVTTGIDATTQAEIGDLPVGRGILGVLIRESAPLRLTDLSQDPRSVGFPPGHPPMRTFLGVPIKLRGSAYGNLYLTEKDGGADFTDEDEEVVTLLASQAAVAIENARLHDASRRWIEALESLTEVFNALAGEVDLQKLLPLIATRLREVLGCRLVLIALAGVDDVLRVEAADGDGAGVARGLSMPIAASKAGRVMIRKRPERIDSVIEDPEADHSSVRLGARTALYVPLIVKDQAIGVIVAHDKPGPGGQFSNADLRLAELFAHRTAVTIDLSRRVAGESLQAILRAQEAERKRLARELHDETGQALTAILLALGTVRDATPDELERTLEGVRQMAVSALEDVRQLAFDLRPKALDDFGLAAALERLAERIRTQAEIHIDVEVSLPGRLEAEVETTAYRIVQEALTNIVKHAGARRVAIVLAQRGGTLSVIVEDDGNGFDGRMQRDGGFGLVAMRERLALIDGRLEIESAAGAGTTLRSTIPLA